jgi:hypothetical protein
MMDDTKKFIKFGILGLFFLFIIVFAFFRSKDLIFGVKIRDVSIVNGDTVTESVLKVTGNAKNALNLKLNGREISLDPQGNFDETIILSSGYNIVNITALDKFDHVDEKNYQLIYK